MEQKQEFVITKTGILKEYNGTEEVVTIPEGVKEISEMAFSWSSREFIKKVIIPEGVKKIKEHAFGSAKNLEEVVFPSTLVSIGRSAFSYCRNLRKISLPNIETLEIGDDAFRGCESLVDENGFFILQDRLFVYHNDATNVEVEIPNTIKKIEAGAFYGFKKFHLTMSIHCPSWKTFGEAKRFGFASSIIARSGSTISFQDDTGNIVAKVILANDGETEPKENLTYLSIRSENGKFDFKGYDKTFALLGKDLNKIDIAIVRVLYPYELSDEMLEVYLTFLKKKAFLVGCMLIDKDDLDTMDALAQKDIFSKNALIKLIDYSSEKQKVSVTAWLLDCKNKITNAPKTKESRKLSKEKKESKSTILWKKPKAGTYTVSRYLGEEEIVQFPLEVEGISIEGIANTAGKTPENYKKIKHIVLPEGYLYIGNKAFAGCEALETIVLPSTLKEIGSQAFAQCKNLKEIVLSEKIDFFGNNIFADAVIETVVMHVGEEKIPTHLFFGCHIKKFVVCGENFKSNGYVFDYTEIGMCEEGKEPNFPEHVYLNGEFSTLDLSGIGGANAKKIHPLSSFEESYILDEKTREAIATQKKNAKKVVDHLEKIIEATTVAELDFKGKTFVITGFPDYQEWDIKEDLKRRGAIVQENVSSDINYLLIPKEVFRKNTKCKEAVKLQQKGSNIVIISWPECKKHMVQYEKKVWES